MNKQEFEDFAQKSYDIVKNNKKHPMRLFRDEMVHYNIVMYSFFNCFYNNSQLNILSTFAELNYIFNRILLNSNARDDYKSFLEKYSTHYTAVRKSFDEDPSVQGVRPEVRVDLICKECMRLVATSCEAEAQSGQSLRVTDTFILCVIMAEELGIDFNKIIELTQVAADELVKIIEEQEKDSGEAKEEPTKDNN